MSTTSEKPINEEEILRINNSVFSDQPLINPTSVQFSRRKRWWLFIYFVLINTIINLDHGIIPGALSEIEEKIFNSNSSEMGLFSSLVFLGALIGSLVSLYLINILNRKILLIASLMLCSASLLVFTFSKKKKFLYPNRVSVGIFQAFISIYLPVWCNQYGVDTNKTMMIALAQVAPPLGVLLGYSIVILSLKFFKEFPTNIDIPFAFQSGLVFLLSLILCIIPNKYFSAYYQKAPVPRVEEENKNVIDKRESGSIFFEEKGSLSINESDEKQSEHKDNPHKSFWSKVKVIFITPVYIFSVLALSTLFFILTIIQYWGSEYMENIVGIHDKFTRLCCIGIICLTSPILGLIIGGAVITYMGGYESKHSILFCFICSLLSAGCTIPIPFCESKSNNPKELDLKAMMLFTFSLWLVMFFGGALISPLEGIIISCLPKSVAGTANSLNIFTINLFGYLPAPFVYGTIKQLTNEKIAMKCGLWSSILGVIFILISLICRYKTFNKNEKINNLIDEKSEKEKDNNKNNKDKSSSLIKEEDNEKLFPSNDININTVLNINEERGRKEKKTTQKEE